MRPSLRLHRFSESYRSRTASDLLAELGSSPAGLSGDEAGRRPNRDGPNTLRPRRQVTRLALLTRQFTSLSVLILLAATGPSALLADSVDAATIAAIAGSAELAKRLSYRLHPPGESVGLSAR
ncbi:MAG: cation-transporting P-type ATPase [Armatimonadota bacterium]|nr:cation-transporting P-type ATPase [Armatimonadota bacterium]